MSTSTMTADEMNQRTHEQIRPAHAWPCRSRCRLARKMSEISRDLPGWGICEVSEGSTWKAMLSNGEDHEHGFGDTMDAAIDVAVRGAKRSQADD